MSGACIRSFYLDLVENKFCNNDQMVYKLFSDRPFIELSIFFLLIGGLLN